MNDNEICPYCGNDTFIQVDTKDDETAILECEECGGHIEVGL